MCNLFLRSSIECRNNIKVSQTSQSIYDAAISMMNLIKRFSGTANVGRRVDAWRRHANLIDTQATN